MSGSCLLGWFDPTRSSVKLDQNNNNNTTTKPHDDDEESVTLILKYFVEHDESSSLHDGEHHSDKNMLFEKLKDKMRRKSPQQGFSLNTFKLRALMGNSDQLLTTFQNTHELFLLMDDVPLSEPFDIKISYNHECILCTDCATHRIHFFDLHSKQFKFSISTPSSGPMFLCVEESYRDAFSDALFFDCKGDKSLHKYDLDGFLSNKRLYQNADSNIIESTTCKGKLWVLDDIKGITGISLLKFQSKLFIGTFDRSIKVLNSKTGMLLHVIPWDGLPLTIHYFAMDQHDYLAIGGWNKFGILCKKKLLQDDKQVGSQVGSHEGMEWCHLHKPFDLRDAFGSDQKILRKTYGTTMDPISHCLIVQSENSILFYNLFENTHLDWILHKKLEDDFKGPQGLCINERTGELLICERNGSRIRIYQ
ncbi:hypothetical protein FDP41_011126 [Naegleria fowleri]|uniref:Uncharacterized protein n=1 Tax=Naegleria fowleri TaxID=5763 RepID=A0A6A5CC87_NAEFO|nr:uncharacterized protein FDP41_011126 [Naegleria fowleri]KAF0983148.1 hypothetical protein FDP41_011126 [Naegleria fowleri]CAG4710064.1 unnamed protein product [Naegleria fowleri]